VNGPSMPVSFATAGTVSAEVTAAGGQGVGSAPIVVGGVWERRSNDGRFPSDAGRRVVRGTTGAFLSSRQGHARWVTRGGYPGHAEFPTRKAPRKRRRADGVSSRAGHGAEQLTSNVQKKTRSRRDGRVRDARVGLRRAARRVHDGEPNSIRSNANHTTGREVTVFRARAVRSKK
jgi:hypothetical protein